MRAMVGFSGGMRGGQPPDPAFTLVELLVVVAVLAILAALLLPELSRAKQEAQQTKCQSNLRQVGLALRMYVDDNDNRYPFLLGVGAAADPWHGQLAPYLEITAANDTKLTCPAFRAAIRSWTRSQPALFAGPGYSYNAFGTGGVESGQVRLGLGFSPDPLLRGASQAPPISDAEVKVPSEMYAVTDSFYVPLDPALNSGQTSCGHIETFPFLNRTKRSQRTFTGLAFRLQQPPQHRDDANMLFCDGHVSPIELSELFDVKKTAANWNNDYDPHPETW